LERDPVVSIRPFQQRLEYGEVFPGDKAAPRCVCYTEKDGKLSAVDFGEIAFWCNGIDKALRI
jgi:hypothetical protein